MRSSQGDVAANGSNPSCLAAIELVISELLNINEKRLIKKFAQNPRLLLMPLNATPTVFYCSGLEIPLA
jgi:hypothetical protein